jgi:arylsulfatase A-like enzyme
MRNLICGLVLLSYSCTSDQAPLKDSVLPNIMIILVDDLGKEWISCYGAEDITTPHIDQLAKSGTKFNNVYGMPQCTPTRVTILTGQYPFRHGWVNHWDVPRWGGGAHFDESMNPSLAIEMRKAGYKTCIAGKWQIDDFRVEPDALTKNGFDEYCMWTGYETGNPDPSGNRYHDPYLFTNKGSKSYQGAYGPDIFKDFIINFIHTNKESPMFIFYPMVLTHTPFENPPQDSAADNLGKHKAMVKYTDRITGELVHALDEAGIRDNTLIIWTTDNGTTGQIVGTLSGRKVQGGKSKTKESGVCLPFIVSWPAILDSNASSDALIDFSDIFPTCLDIACINVGREWKQNNNSYTMDGYSFKDVLLHNEDAKREWILSMGGGNNARLTENGVENQYVFRDRVLRNKRYKLHINSKREAAGFYDLMEDPDEQINLIDSLSKGNRRKNFDELYETLAYFPRRDADPKYSPNPPQPWDVAITAQSQVWKK